jgi:hypothetical protein
VATTIKRAANVGYNAILIKDATSGFTDGNYNAMLDILPLYAKLISSAEFTLEAPYGGTARSEATRDARNSFSGQSSLASPVMGLRQRTRRLGKRLIGSRDIGTLDYR